jgi:hypothetical protein
MAQIKPGHGHSSPATAGASLFFGRIINYIDLAVRNAR